ncbi:RluA family pseudouridine synthase [uncultured Helicobacter sp.]|uniref:RluA family pseudouridine synthase n=1 Tax=uncultured Helicobacter sp. TaxID=175537 RepID=UPI0026314DC8|nr:RluA family pseudouridine synthase [uncultured Helicobacter sp.]
MPFMIKEFPIPTPTRAYKFLMQVLHLSMAESQKYINKGRVIYKGKALQNNEKAKMLEKSVCILIFEPDSMGLKPIYENEDFAIFNKPAKMLIHPKGRFAHYSFIDEVRTLYGNKANLVHRIDKETSGLVVVGKHKKSIVELGAMFANNEIVKEYLALVQGDFSKSYSRDFCLSLPLATQPKGGDLCVRSKFLGQSGAEMLKFKEAKSEFEVLGSLEIPSMSKKFLKILQQDSANLSFLAYLKENQSKEFQPESICCTLLKVRPKTGRTHQIRIHLYALNFPILGDPLYGAEDKHSREYLNCEFITQEGQNFFSDSKRLQYFGATRLMLHAYSLKFNFYGQPYYFQSSKNFEIL